MSPFRPEREDLPEEFPVFPLTGALLLPQGRLPLNIFEPRYLAMIEDALAAKRMFGMIQPDRGLPDGPTGPGLFRVGCLGRLSSFSETEDGRYLITLTGVIRFRIVTELEMRRGYRRARADFSRFLTDLAAPAEPPMIDRAAILAALRGYFDHRGFNANWDAINAMGDDELVVSLGMACPFEPAEKQALLEAPTHADRAQTLLALLNIDMHGPNDEAAASRPRAS
jgi:Lon protease-like protein